MKLSVSDRMAIFQILPERFSFADYQVVRRLREGLTLTDHEKVATHFQVDEKAGLMKWDEVGVPPVDIPISADGLALIKRRLAELNEGQQLTRRTAELYERFQNVTTEVVDNGAGPDEE